MNRGVILVSDVCLFDFFALLKTCKDMKPISMTLRSDVYAVVCESPLFSAWEHGSPLQECVCEVERTTSGTVIKSITPQDKLTEKHYTKN